jgi:hypothetical protein
LVRYLRAPADWPRYRGSKVFVQCPECGRRGMPGGTWADACLRNGHPYWCMCGRMFSTRTGLSSHVRRTRAGDHAELDIPYQS